MGSYSYCRRCDQGLDEATIDEVLDDNQECPHCGYGNKPNRNLNDMLRELISTVHELSTDLNTARAQIEKLEEETGVAAKRRRDQHAQKLREQGMSGKQAKREARDLYHTGAFDR